jgi:hypothetical protein
VTLDSDKIDVPAWHRGDDFHVYKEGYTAGWAVGLKAAADYWAARWGRPAIEPVPDMKAHELLNLLLDDLDALVDNSEGVAGLHPNGDVASWESLREGGRFETWLMRMDEARAFLDSTMDKPDDIATAIQPVPVAEDQERLRIMEAGIRYGYKAGHHDTVEACYGDPDNIAADYAPEILEEMQS